MKQFKPGDIVVNKRNRWCFSWKPVDTFQNVWLRLATQEEIDFFKQNIKQKTFVVLPN